MRLVSTALGAALFGIALLASNAQAQAGGPEGLESGRIVSFGLGGGVSVPVNDAKNAFENGFNGNGFVRFNLRSMAIAPRLEFTFSQFDLASAKLQAPGASGTSQIFAGLGALQFSLIDRGPVRPYIVAGVGAYSFRNEVSGVPGATTTSDTRWGVNGGAGVLVKLGRVVSAYVEGRVDNVFTDQGVIDAKQIQVVPVTFGVVF